jgi:hypothetical protein
MAFDPRSQKRIIQCAPQPLNDHEAHCLLLLRRCLPRFAAQAQIYQWQDENNKTVISDRPPVGKVKGPRQIDADAPPEGWRKPARRWLTARWSFASARRSRAKAPTRPPRISVRGGAEGGKTATPRAARCRLLESGERVAMRDSKGERYYLDDEQRAQEIAKLREDMQASCQ